MKTEPHTRHVATLRRREKRMAAGRFLQRWVWHASRRSVRAAAALVYRALKLPPSGSASPHPAYLDRRWVALPTVVRLLAFVAGLWIMSLGIVAVVQAHLGASPWDVLHLGISRKTGLSFGRVQQLVGVVILAGACLLLKKWPSLGAVGNMLLVGEFCDWILRWHLVPEFQALWARIGLLAVGILIWGLGTGIYIQANLGAGPRDWLMLALHQKTGWAVRWVRTLLETTAVGLGIWLGGPFAWGTLAFSFTIGHATELGLRLAKKWLGRITEGGKVA